MMEDTTGLLLALRNGHRAALDDLLPHVYEELHRIAHRELARRGAGGSVQTTGLLHEAYIKLVDQARLDIEDRAHFFALAATAMRHILVDYARARRTRKRGGGWKRITLDRIVGLSDDRLEEMIEVDEALARLQKFDQRLYTVVECRFFGGMTVNDTALALGVSSSTVDRAWQKAKAWLYREMQEA